MILIYEFKLEGDSKQVGISMVHRCWGWELHKLVDLRVRQARDRLSTKTDKNRVGLLINKNIARQSGDAMATLQTLKIKLNNNKTHSPFCALYPQVVSMLL